MVREHLADDEAALFWKQQYQDQRHALEVAARVAAVRGDDRVAIKAALLHDVGKRYSRLGAFSRSLATVLDATGLPLPDRMAAYRAHGSLGARELEACECEPLVVEFAGRHPGPAPVGIDPARWRALLEADDV